MSALQRFCFEPGTGSRYDLLYGSCPPFPGMTGGGHVLVWLSRGGSGGAAFRFDDGITPFAGYLMEKMDIPKHLAGDAHALLAFLRIQGHETQVVGDFDAAGQFIRPNAIEFDGGTNDMTDAEIASMTNHELREELRRLRAVFDQGGGKDTRLGEKVDYFWALVESRKGGDK